MAYQEFLKAKREAQAIIKSLYISDPRQIQLLEIAATYDVFCQELEIEGADARLRTYHDKGIISIKSDIPEPGRKRFAIAHEIGHFILHRQKEHVHQCNAVDFLKWYHQSAQEPEANVFAAELLMPEAMFVRQCVGRKPGFGTVSELRSIFDVSLTASAYRYVEIGNYPCALVASQKGKIAWYCCSREFSCRIHTIGTSVNKNSCSADFFINKNIPPDNPERVPRESWLENPALEAGSDLYEHAIAMPNYETVLSLIWLA